MRKGFGGVKEEIHMHEVSELRSEIAEVKATMANSDGYDNADA